MPEIPELQHIAQVLTDRLRGRAIANVDIQKPIVIRLPREDFEAGLLGAEVHTVERTGKFLLFHTNRDSVMAVNPMLTGRFQWISAPHGKGKAHARTCFTLNFEAPEEEVGIRYIDERYLGKVYLVDAEDLDQIPVLNEQGPDALDPALDQDEFLKRLKRYRGQVKNALVNAKFVAGIGNAYSDEILFNAGIHPFTKISTLPEERRIKLFHAMQETLDWAAQIAANEIGLKIDRKPRDFLNVHRKGGEPCPRCDSPISEVAPNRRITSFCRSCQPM
ncbi:MAG: Fpg/Nei family DNA glycosylase [Chloroflexi bacterium]|nr:Fpg/Nei family DNA glycosylase [Chloroflexota bacterium]